MNPDRQKKRTRATTAKIKIMLNRIKNFEIELIKAHEYLESGKHAHWGQFSPLFVEKFKEGKKVPPHKDWVKNVFIPRVEKNLALARKNLEKLDPP